MEGGLVWVLFFSTIDLSVREFDYTYRSQRYDASDKEMDGEVGGDGGVGLDDRPVDVDES